MGKQTLQYIPVNVDRGGRASEIGMANAYVCCVYEVQPVGRAGKGCLLFIQIARCQEDSSRSLRNVSLNGPKPSKYIVWRGTWHRTVYGNGTVTFPYHLLRIWTVCVVQYVDDFFPCTRPLAEYGVKGYAVGNRSTIVSNEKTHRQNYYHIQHTRRSAVPFALSILIANKCNRTLDSSTMGSHFKWSKYASDYRPLNGQHRNIV